MKGEDAVKDVASAVQGVRKCPQDFGDVRKRSRLEMRDSYAKNIALALQRVHDRSKGCKTGGDTTGHWTACLDSCDRIFRAHVPEANIIQ